jgi:predicted PurR-regulated permease PerM
VTYLADRGWRRGVATALIFVTGIVAVLGMLALIVPAVVSGVNQLIVNAPELVGRLARWLEPLGFTVSQAELLAAIRENGQELADRAADLAGGLFAITSSILGALFRWATIGLFTFYLVAEGPKLRRVVCSMLPPERQERVLFIWEQAIVQTGGYFYSRLLLAIVNAIGMYITLLLVDVPFAAPLAIFQGVVAAFIPIVGTYIGGAAPILVAFLTSPSAGIVATIYIVIYQQVENYILSPRLTARTMSLHPAVAFAAALIGASMGGILMAFLALPAAGVIQAAAKAWGRRYVIVETDLTEEMRIPSERPRFVERLRETLAPSDDE